MGKTVVIMHACVKNKKRKLREDSLGSFSVILKNAVRSRIACTDPRLRSDVQSRRGSLVREER